MSQILDSVTHSARALSQYEGENFTIVDLSGFDLLTILLQVKLPDLH